MDGPRNGTTHRMAINRLLVRFVRGRCNLLLARFLLNARLFVWTTLDLGNGSVATQRRFQVRHSFHLLSKKHLIVVLVAVYDSGYTPLMVRTKVKGELSKLGQSFRSHDHRS
jgi:hypothetical protein